MGDYFGWSLASWRLAAELETQFPQLAIGSCGHKKTYPGHWSTPAAWFR